MVDRKEVKLQIGTNVIQTGAEYDWILTSIKGDDYMDVQVKIEDYADSDGGYKKSIRYLPRYIDMKIKSKVASDELINATQILLHSYIDSKADSIFTEYKNGVVRIGYGYIADVKKVDGDHWYDPPYIKVTFVMPDPWYVGEQITNDFASFTPVMTFPLSFIASVGLTVSVASFGNEITFDYAGNEGAGFLMTLTATGACVNPTIANSSGRYIKVLKTLADGDIITISTIKGDKYVRCNGTTCKYDRLSIPFFGLEVGSNTLTVSADSGIDNITKSLVYRERFRG